MRKVRQAVANVSELTPDIGKVVAIGDGHCTVFLHQGGCYAVGSLCPHQNATLDGAVIQNNQVICRRHGYRFDAKSGDCLTIGGYGLPTFDTDIEGDTLFVSYWEYE